jgi:hypothetical protein
MKGVSPAQLRRFNQARRPSILEPSKQRIAEELVPLQVTAVVSCPCRRSLNSKVKIFDGVEMRATFSAICATLKEIIIGGVVVTVTNVSQQPRTTHKGFTASLVQRQGLCQGNMLMRLMHGAARVRRVQIRAVAPRSV